MFSHEVRLLAKCLKKPVRAELVEACDVKLGDARTPGASLGIVRLCPSTGSGRTFLFSDSANDKCRVDPTTGLLNYSNIKQTRRSSWWLVQRVSSSLFVRRYAVLAHLLVILHRLVRHSRGVHQSAHAGLESRGSHGLTTGGHRAIVDRSGQSFVGRMPAAPPAMMSFWSRSR